LRNGNNGTGKLENVPIGGNGTTGVGGLARTSPACGGGAVGSEGCTFSKQKINKFFMLSTILT
jgi:hypothetical protein